MSAVWTDFTISEKDPRIAICKTCNAEISRGGASAKSFSTSGLIHHLESKHPDRHSEYEKKATQKRKLTPSTPTPSVADVFEKARKFSSDSAKAKGITHKIMEFIALDDQPFSIVEDVGFRRLIDHIEPRYAMPSRRHFSDVCLPELFNIVATHVHKLLASDITAISFTTDIWSSDVSLTSMLSLTAQWIDKDFKLQKILLHSQEFRGSHTAAAISDAFTNMCDTWHIDRSKVHAIVSDNARNMTKAIEDSQLKGIRCMAHTLHLAVNEGVLSQRNVKDILTIGRRIVGHFKHSQLAYSRLQSMQDQLGTQIKRFQQDVRTRWNGTFYMLESLFAQKRVLAAYSADHELPATFTSHQWVLIENILSVLDPFEQLTKEISSFDASVADVIPLIAALKRLLSKEVETDHGVKTIKSTLLESVKRRFTESNDDPLHFIATVLDPRYKDHYLDVGIKQCAREMIQAAMDADNPLGDRPAHSAGGEQSAEKRTRHSALDEGHAPLLSDMFNEILQESAPNNRQPTSSTAQQLDGYLSEVPISRSDDPLAYWRNNHGRFPDLAKMARKYLSAPCTSTDSERLFSAAAHVLDEKRNRLHCDKAEKLLFIKKNLPLYLKK
ncbi:zinc finger BED domain-containing protein 4-like [Syngnathus typhle]|uniref:zinc finger BED domain-containing protein 4-like n=1 Tax=Syngnathus typhle TaxID=161592 RepID=UPI002A6B177A|nr:zinc finger BED domain-containing protein 4-like [Syngnathus typhle]